MNDRDSVVMKTVEMTAVAIQALELASQTIDDEGERRWSDEDGWSVEIDNGDCITVTITRCNRGFIEVWYVPEIESADEFNRDLIRFVRETAGSEAA